jgi:hypothetical protein
MPITGVYKAGNPSSSENDIRLTSQSFQGTNARPIAKATLVELPADFKLRSGVLAWHQLHARSDARCRRRRVWDLSCHLDLSRCYVGIIQAARPSIAGVAGRPKKRGMDYGARGACPARESCSLIGPSIARWSQASRNPSPSVSASRSKASHIDATTSAKE